jgi:hypothetical protein
MMAANQVSLKANRGVLTVKSGSLAGDWMWPVGLTIVLILGAAFRLVWISDMEYKADEAWTFEQVQQVREGGPVPALGMPTSQGFLNPGLSLWVFLPLAEIANIQDPRDLARAVVVLNIVALVGLAVFALLVVPRQEREVWLWAAALVAVNPLAVLFQRKIWPPSVFPVISVLFLLSWWYRERRWGALFWGLIGAGLGQIDGPGYFFAAGFVLWALLFERRRVAWGSWFIGSCLGALPLIPWLNYLLYFAHFRPHNPRAWVHALEGKFWSRWILEPLGFGLDYSLNRDFFAFLRYPYLGRIPSYLGLVWHVVVGVIGAVIALRAVQRFRSNALGTAFVGRSSATAFAQSAALWGYGLLFTLSLLPLNRHYMIILFPLQFVWLAGLALWSPRSQSLNIEARDVAADLKFGRVLLTLLVVCQSCLTLQFLSFVHNQPIIHGDYGVPYRVQNHLPRHALAEKATGEF